MSNAKYFINISLFDRIYIDDYQYFYLRMMSIVLVEY